MNIVLYMDVMYGIIALVMIVHLIGGTDMGNRKKITPGAAQELALAAADYASAQAQRNRENFDAKAKREEDTRRRNVEAIIKDENGMIIRQSSEPLDGRS